MKQISTQEKILFISFIVLSIFILWLISPMGSLYLPVNTDKLKSTTGLTLPDGYVLKKYSMKDTPVFSILNEVYSPHLITIMVSSQQSFEEQDFSFDKSNNIDVKNFWLSTGIHSPSIIGCIDKLVSGISSKTCKYVANKNGLNESTRKQGEISILNKGNQSFYFVSMATEKSYKPFLLNNLIVNVAKSKQS
jgi:hypothetical protein